MGDGLISKPRIAALHAILFAAGAVVTGVGILAGLYLYRFFGDGAETRAALMITVLGSLMTGSFFGGHLADRYPGLRLATVLVAAAAAWIAIVPHLSAMMLPVLLDRAGGRAVVAVFGCAVLVSLPMALLGALLPVVVRGIMADVGHAGRAAGQSFAAAALGGIVGTLVVTFALRLMLGARSITEVLASVTVAGAVALFLMRRA